MANTKTTKGLLGTKLGMTQVWDENNKLVTVTVVEISPNVVTQLRSEEVYGYTAVQIAYRQIDPRKDTKPRPGHYDKAGVTPRRHLTELRTDDTHHVLLGRKRYRANNGGTSTGDRVNDLASRGIDDLVVVRLKSNADLLSRHV